MGLIAVALMHSVHDNVLFTRTDYGGMSGVAYSYVGDYKYTFTVLQNVSHTLKNNNILTASQLKNKNSFGIYYDNPEIVPRDQCRFRAGIILSENELKEIDKIDNLSFDVVKIAPQNLLVGTFPFVSTLSIFLGIFKAYPALSATKAEHGAVMEVYNKTGSVISYVVFDRESEHSMF